MNFYTADLYLILLSDYNDSFSKYNQNIVTDYSFNIDNKYLLCAVYNMNMWAI